MPSLSLTFPSALGKIHLPETLIATYYQNQSQVLRSACYELEIGIVVLSDLARVHKTYVTKWLTSWGSDRSKFVPPKHAHRIYHAFMETIPTTYNCRKYIHTWFGAYIGLHSVYWYVNEFPKYVSQFFHKPFYTKPGRPEYNIQLMDAITKAGWNVDHELNYMHAYQHCKISSDSIHP